MNERSFEAGTLWRAVRRTSEAALRSGALKPLAIETEVVEDRDVAFPVRILSRLDGKIENGRRQRREGTNPFLPYEEAMFVTAVGDTHVCLLNKFNVIADHALIVTREFRPQSEYLAAGDLEALWRCLAEPEPALGFYNAGPNAGASQPHRHLQIVPMPLGTRGEAFPLEPVFASGFDEGVVLGETHGRMIVRLRAFAFAHALVDVSDLAPFASAEASEVGRAIYRDLLRASGCDDPSSYNLLVTRRWMIVVARSRPHWNGIPMNGLSYAGMLMVRSRDQLAALRSIGPFALLAATGIETPSGPLGGRRVFSGDRLSGRMPPDSTRSTS